MKFAALSCAAVVAFAVVPGIAQAGCAGFESVSTGMSVEYDPFSGAPISRPFEIRVRRLDPSATAVRFLLVDPDPQGGQSRFGAGGPRGYDVDWARDSSRPVFFRGAEQPNNTNGALVSFKPGPSGDVVTETFRLQVPAGRPVAAGDYYEPLEVRYVCYSGDERLDAPEVQQAGRVALDLATPDMISAYIGSVGIRRGEINLGTLSADGPAASGQVMITAQATSPYEVSIASKRGVMRRSDVDTAGLRYSMRLGGLPVQPGSTLVCDRTQDPGGRGHPLQVTVRPEDIASQPAGAYSDTVTVTFAPRLSATVSDSCSA